MLMADLPNLCLGSDRCKHPCPRSFRHEVRTNHLVLALSGTDRTSTSTCSRVELPRNGGHFEAMVSNEEVSPWQEADGGTRLSSRRGWWSWSGRAEVRTVWQRSSSRPRRRSGAGWSRRVADITYVPTQAGSHTCSPGHGWPCRGPGGGSAGCPTGRENDARAANRGFMAGSRHDLRSGSRD